MKWMSFPAQIIAHKDMMDQEVKNIFHITDQGHLETQAGGSLTIGLKCDRNKTLAVGLSGTQDSIQVLAKDGSREMVGKRREST